VYNISLAGVATAVIIAVQIAWASPGTKDWRLPRAVPSGRWRLRIA
jgi:hypothetical protein